MEFTVVKTNMLNIVADAIVLPARENLQEGKGVSETIFKAAGREKMTMLSSYCIV